MGAGKNVRKYVRAATSQQEDGVKKPRPEGPARAGRLCEDELKKRSRQEIEFPRSGSQLSLLNLFNIDSLITPPDEDVEERASLMTESFDLSSLNTFFRL